MWKSKFYGAFVLNHRVVLHAIDATPARWRGDAGSSPLDGASTAASSPRNDVCIHSEELSGAPDTLVDFHTALDRRDEREGPFDGAGALQFQTDGPGAPLRKDRFERVAAKGHLAASDRQRHHVHVPLTYRVHVRGPLLGLRGDLCGKQAVSVASMAWKLHAIEQTQLRSSLATMAWGA